MPCCAKCGKETNNPKYCSRSCAISISNVNSPKRKPLGVCKQCGKQISTRMRYCPTCPKRNRSTIDNLTLKETESLKYLGKDKYARIRCRARHLFKGSDKPKCCHICGYDKYYEVCHIKPIGSFDKSTLIKEINHETNLIGLCPNHHWELDHGLVSLPEL